MTRRNGFLQKIAGEDTLVGYLFTYIAYLVTMPKNYGVLVMQKTYAATMKTLYKSYYLSLLSFFFLINQADEMAQFDDAQFS